MTTVTYAESALDRANPPLRGVNQSSPPAPEMTLEFGRFRVVVRQRRLVADGMLIDLGTRAFDLLLVLLEADGSLVTKDELLSRVWPGVVVAEENLKVQIFALRKALGDDHYFIRTEFGRGYRFTAAIRSALPRGACQRPTRPRYRSGRLVPQWISQRQKSTVRMSEGQASRRVDPAHARAACTGLVLRCKKEENVAI